ncbi:MAG: hypothetical protein Q8Q85_01430 [Gemmatimonadales bacterium]|nr:hypothetical protein [Gemmatimonadales bacterium]
MRKRLAVTIAAVALIAGCTESTGPPRAAPPNWAVAASSGVERHILRQAATAPPLETYETRVWVVQGRRTRVQVDYVGGRNFLRLEFPADALFQRPDGTRFKEGEGIEITLTIDPTRLLLYLEPSGLVFSDESPARLNIWYGNADADLNRDGLVDGTDSTIEQSYLGMWYQASPGEPWETWPEDHIKYQKRFRTDLYHFSGYAVSW